MRNDKLLFGEILLIFGLVIMVSTSCKENSAQENTSKIELDPHGAVNIEIKVKHENGYDVMSTSKIIHDLKGNIVNTILTIDTLPSLGITKDTLDTGRTHENDEGDNVETDTIITHPKDYQLYISVKK